MTRARKPRKRVPTVVVGSHGGRVVLLVGAKTKATTSLVSLSRRETKQLIATLTDHLGAASDDDMPTPVDWGTA